MSGLTVVWQQREIFLIGLANTASLAALCALFSVPLGFLGAVVLVELPRPLGRVGQSLVDLMRCVPFLLLAYVIYYGLPELGLRFDAWWAGLVTLVAYNTAYVVEIVRSGVLAIPPDHLDAARAFGFTRTGLYRRIVLPQVAARAAPLLGNQLIMMIKDTALLMIITVQEITFAANFVNASAFSPFAPFAVAVALYWGLCLLVEAATRVLGAPMRLWHG